MIDQNPKSNQSKFDHMSVISVLDTKLADDMVAVPNTDENCIFKFSPAVRCISDSNSSAILTDKS